MAAWSPLTDRPEELDLPPKDGRDVEQDRSRPANESRRVSRSHLEKERASRNEGNALANVSAHRQT